MARKKPGIGAEASAFTMSGNPGLVMSLLKAPLRSIWRTSAWRVASHAVRPVGSRTRLTGTPGRPPGGLARSPTVRANGNIGSSAWS